MEKKEGRKETEKKKYYQDIVDVGGVAKVGRLLELAEDRRLIPEANGLIVRSRCQNRSIGAVVQGPHSSRVTLTQRKIKKNG